MDDLGPCKTCQSSGTKTLGFGKRRSNSCASTWKVRKAAYDYHHLVSGLTSSQKLRAEKPHSKFLSYLKSEYCKSEYHKYSGNHRTIQEWHQGTRKLQSNGQRTAWLVSVHTGGLYFHWFWLIGWLVDWSIDSNHLVGCFWLIGWCVQTFSK